jgi:hypothetical protein
MILSKDSVQLSRPIDFQLFTHQTLRSFDVADPSEAVLFFAVAHLVAIHLPTQPFPSIEADLDQERKPALQPQVHQAELRMQMVEIEVLALAALELKFQFFGLAITAQKIGPAGFNTPKNPDQAFLQMILFDEFPGQRFLAEMTGAQILKRTPGLFGHLECGGFDPLRQVNREILKVFEKKSFDLQVGFHGPGAIKLWQAAFEPQTIKA